MNPYYVYPLPRTAEKRHGYFILQECQTITVPRSFSGEQCAFYAELYKNFSLGLSKAEFAFGEEGKIILGKGEAGGLCGCDFSVSVTEQGICLEGKDAQELARAFTVFLQMFRPVGDVVATDMRVACGYFCEKAELSFRGVHYCLFPSTSLEALKQFIRLSGMYRYTHFVLEFWGTYAFKTFPLLGWAGHSYTEKDLTPILNEARWLGMEVVPFFNHLGHAAQSRVNGADHVVLGQNPLYAPLFEPDGWTWCVTNPSAKQILGDVRKELAKLAGKGEYFHIGMDESFSFATCERCLQAGEQKLLFANYVNEIAASLKKDGRRAIMWGDQLLDPKRFPAPYSANQVPGGETCGAIGLLDKSVVIADWQYDVREGEVETSQFFRQNGFEVLGSPWEDPDNIHCHVQTAVNNGGKGILLTTWNATHPFIARLLQAADEMCGGRTDLTYAESMSLSGNILRKISSGTDRPGAGWLGTRTLF